MGFLAAVGVCFRKYFTFSGRASRAEYWWWTLFLILGSFAYSLAGQATLMPLVGTRIEDFSGGDAVWIIFVASAFWVFTLVPTLAVTVRRLHDTGRSGFWVLVPWLLNAVMFWGALMARPAELSALGLKGIEGDPMLGGALMLGAGIGALIVSIMLLIWMLKAGTRGENYFGPDPRGGGSDGEDYVQSYMPQVSRAAKPATPQMSHREEISALYRQRVLGNQGRQG